LKLNLEKTILKMKFKLKESAYIFCNGEEYQVFFTGTRKIKTYKVDGLIKGLIDELEIPKDRKELVEKLNNYSAEEVESGIRALESEGIIRMYDHSFSNKFSRQLLFFDELTSSWEETMQLQEKLENSEVSVIGVGGIGSWIVNGLYQIAVGKINISDPDVVSESNLNRQLFFNSYDVGKYKVDVLKSKLPDANINSFRRKISLEDSLEDIVKDSDLIINCADHPSVHETTRIISSYAEKRKIAYCVAGGYNMHLGMVGPIFVPGKTASFEDYITFQGKNDPFKNLDLIKDVEQTGSIGPLTGAIANMQVMEILKHIIGKGKNNYNSYLEIDFLNNTSKRIYFSNPLGED